VKHLAPGDKIVFTFITEKETKTNAYGLATYVCTQKKKKKKNFSSCDIYP
jgi:hypothetical protein